MNPLLSLGISMDQFLFLALLLLHVRFYALSFSDRLLGIILQIEFECGMFVIVLCCFQIIFYKIGIGI